MTNKHLYEQARKSKMVIQHLSTKNLFRVVFLFIALSSCDRADHDSHSSLAIVSNFIQTEQQIKTLNITGINVNKFELTDHQDFHSNNVDIKTRSLEIMYDLTLMGRWQRVQVHCTSNQ